MPALLWLIIAFILGDMIAAPIVGNTSLWLRLAAGYICGIVVMGWASYGAISFFVSKGIAHPMILANWCVMGAAGAVIILVRVVRRKRIQLREAPGWFETGLFLVIAVFISVSTYLVFRVTGNSMFSGTTVYSDYSPHISMIRSFSRGINYPTCYTFFAGRDLRYHFMYMFLCGNLEFLGWRIDTAFNVPFIIALSLLAMCLAEAANKICGSKAGMILAPAFFFFRSGTALYMAVRDHSLALSAFFTYNSSFPEYTEHEGWGLWNFNVYLNQRHLGVVALMGILAVLYFYPYLGKGNIRSLAEKKAWAWRNPCAALAVGVLLGACAFWNGAVVVGTLLVLFGMALFSSGKTDYLLTAAVAIVLSWIQTRIFIQGESFSPSLYLGFLTRTKTFGECLWFIFEIFGLTLIGIPLLIFFMDKREARFASALFWPVLFTFTVSLTVDVTVNHKYLMLAAMLACPLWASFLVYLWRGSFQNQSLAARTATSGPLRRLIVAVLVVFFTANGIYDYSLIVRNSADGRVVDLDSKVSKWITEHTKRELILVPWLSYDDVTATGCMMYSGWPYYAWSAGYDTAYRGRKTKEIYTTKDEKRLIKTAKEEGISYIIYRDSTFDGVPSRHDVMDLVFKKELEDEETGTIIYRVNDRSR